MLQEDGKEGEVEQGEGWPVTATERATRRRRGATESNTSDERSRSTTALNTISKFTRPLLPLRLCSQETHHFHVKATALGRGGILAG
jgi:hypothetical protein